MEPTQLPPSENVRVFAIAWAGLLAMMGGLVREISSEGQHTVLKFISGAVVGVFCGLVMFCICRHFELEGWLTGALSGLGGYMGTPLLDLFSNIIKKRIKKS